MIRQFSKINWISFFIAFVAYFVLGALWFTLFFSDAYKFSLGREHETLATDAIFVVGPALCTLIVTLASALLFYSLPISSYKEALEFAFVIGIGFLVANTFNIAINPNIPRPILYGIISGSYHMLGILSISMIFMAMKK